MADRLLGQDTEVVVIKDNEPILTITAVKSFELGIQLEVLREAYLGETTDRRDDVFRGIRARLELTPEGREPIDLAVAVKERAQNRRSGVKISVKSTFSFPNGDRVIVVVPDCKFGEIPIGAPGRTDYVSMTYDVEADDFKVVSR